MKQDYFRKFQFFLIVAFGMIPVPLVLLAYVASNLLSYIWIFPAAYVVWGAFSMLVPGKLRIPYGIVGVLLLLIPGFVIPDEPTGTQAVLWVVGGIYGVLLMLSLQFAAWEREREFPVTVAGLCLVPHGIGQFLALMDSAYAEPMQRILPWMSASLIAFVGLIMLSMNRSSISAVIGKRTSTAAGIRRKNILLTAALFGLGTFASLVPSILGSVFRFFGWIGEWINKLRELFQSDTELPVPTQPTTLPIETEGGGLELIGKYDPEAVKIMYIILLVLGALILLPVLVIALIRIFRAIRRLGQKLWEWLMHMSASASEDYYEDEITDTRDDAQWEKTKRERRERRKAAFVFEQRLTAAERIRRRYQRLASKHKDWKAASTARENLPAEAAAFYERARYSSHPISDEDAAQFKAKTRNFN